MPVIRRLLQFILRSVGRLGKSQRTNRKERVLASGEKKSEQLQRQTKMSRNSDNEDICSKRQN